MKIAFVTETYPPEVNGVALTVQSLVLHCRKLGHFVELFRPVQPASTQPRSAADADRGTQRLIVEHLLPGARLPFYASLRFGLPAKARLIAQWREMRPDGVYVATEGPLGWSAVAAARALNIPVVTGLHTRFDDFMGHYGLWFLRGAAFAFMRAFHNRAKATLVPTRSLQALLQSSGFRSVERLQRAVDTQQFSPQHRCPNLRQKWGSGNNSPTLLHVGRMAPEKNLQLAVRAFAKIRERFPNARFVWVGDGPSLAQLKSQLADDPAHIFCGMLRGAALSQAYASADMFVFPSLSETFGNVTLEALASGLPVCAFDYGAAEESIVNHVNGHCVAFGDEAQFIASAATLAQAVSVHSEVMRESARASVAHLDPAEVARALVELLQRLGAEQGVLEQTSNGVSHVQLERH